MVRAAIFFSCFAFDSVSGFFLFFFFFFFPFRFRFSLRATIMISLFFGMRASRLFNCPISMFLIIKSNMCDTGLSFRSWCDKFGWRLIRGARDALFSPRIRWHTIRMSTFKANKITMPSSFRTTFIKWPCRVTYRITQNTLTKSDARRANTPTPRHDDFPAHILCMIALVHHVFGVHSAMGNGQCQPPIAPRGDIIFGDNLLNELPSYFNRIFLLRIMIQWHAISGVQPDN